MSLFKIQNQSAGVHVAIQACLFFMANYQKTPRYITLDLYGLGSGSQQSESLPTLISLAYISTPYLSTKVCDDFFRVIEIGQVDISKIDQLKNTMLMLRFFSLGFQVDSNLFINNLDCENGYFSVLDHLISKLQQDDDWLFAAALESAVLQFLELLIVSMTIH